MERTHLRAGTPAGILDRQSRRLPGGGLHPPQSRQITCLSAAQGLRHPGHALPGYRGPRNRSTPSSGIAAVVLYPSKVAMIYLDNAATSFPKPEAVYRALDRFARQDLANPGRAGHKMALAAERALDDTRHLLNQLFHGQGPERFCFALNFTDALNMAFTGSHADADHDITPYLVPHDG